jgi:hypothetical protein
VRVALQDHLAIETLADGLRVVAKAEGDAATKICQCR